MDLISEMRGQVELDSALFGPRLRAATPEPAYSGAFRLACAACAGERQYGLALEYIFEGYLLHYGTSRLLEPGSLEFGLLAGDYMFARGLTQVSSLEDLFSIGVLADLISLCSHLHSREEGQTLALDVWEVATLCIAMRASHGAESCAAHRGELARFRDSAWRGAAGPGGLDALRESLLGGLGANARGEVEAVFAGVRRLHGAALGRERSNGQGTGETIGD